MQGVYVLTLYPDIIFSDSPELITSCYTMGISHPTGYSLYTLLGHLFALVGNRELTAWRLNYFSSFWATISVLVWYHIASRFLLFNLKDENYRRFLSFCVSICIGTSQLFWSQSISAEVYTFQWALMMGAMWAYFHWEEDHSYHFLLLFFFLTGIGFTHHLLSITLLIPCVIIMVFKDVQMRTARVLMACVGMLGLGFLLTLYFPLRAHTYPVINWWNPQNYDNYLNLLTGGQFKLRMFSNTLAVVNPQNNFIDALNKYVQYGLVQFYNPVYSGIRSLSVIWLIINLALGILTVTGLYELFRHKRDTFYFLVLFLLMQLAVVTNYHILDIQDYYVPTVLGLCFCMVVGWGVIANKLMAQNNRLLLYCIPAFIGVLPFLSNYSAIHPDVVASQSAVKYSQNLLNNVEPNAIVITGGDYDIFPLWYEKYVLQNNPGVTVFGANFLASGWYKEFFRHEQYPFPMKVQDLIFQSQEEYMDFLHSAILNPNQGVRPIYFTYGEPLLMTSGELELIGNLQPFLKKKNVNYPQPSMPLYKLTSGITESPSFSMDTANAVTMLDSAEGWVLQVFAMNQGRKYRAGDYVQMKNHWKLSPDSMNSTVMFSLLKAQDKEDAHFPVMYYRPSDNNAVDNDINQKMEFNEQIGFVLPYDLNPGVYSLEVMMRPAESTFSLNTAMIYHPLVNIQVEP